MATTIQDFVDSIATKAGVDPATAETAIGTILSAIQQEGDATKVGQLFNQIPGAADLAQKHAVVVGSGGGVLGTLSGLAGSVVGKDAGVMVAAIGQLEETNLTMEQIKKIGTAVLSYLKESANPALAKNIMFDDYGAGHMMYLNTPDLKKQKGDLARFVRETARK